MPEEQENCDKVPPSLEAKTYGFPWEVTQGKYDPSKTFGNLGDTVIKPCPEDE